MAFLPRIAASSLLRQTALLRAGSLPVVLRSASTQATGAAAGVPQPQNLDTLSLLTAVEKPGSHGSRVLHIDSLPTVPSPSDFRPALQACMTKWQQSGIHSAWLKLHISQSGLIPAAAELGFQFHNAEGETVHLHIWSKAGVPCKVPPLATHHIGVAGIVIDEEEQLLVVKEAHYAYTGWKFPGGRVDKAEELGTAAAREVWEETGVQADAKSMLLMRHTHRQAFGMSDLFCMMRLSPKAGVQGAKTITLDPEEIQDAMWMPAEKFVRETNHPLNCYAVQMALQEQRQERSGRQPSCSIASLPSFTDAPSSFLAEQVFVPVLKKEVTVYRPSSAPSFKEAVGHLQADLRREAAAATAGKVVVAAAAAAAAVSAPAAPSDSSIKMEKKQSGQQFA